jgi:4-hydroxyphenylpyruvate dioxygenase-like putative hemolysin
MPTTYESACQRFRALGFTLLTFELEDDGLRVALDWDGGIEVVTTLQDPSESDTGVGRFLVEHGEGVYSLVVRTPDAETSAAIDRAAGARTRFRQQRDVGASSLVEIDTTPVHGVGLTWLETDLDPGS